MNADTHQRLAGVLDREIETARALAATLDEERTALTGLIADAVTTVAAQKIGLLARIEALETQRRELCDTASISLPNRRNGTTPLKPDASDAGAGVSDPIADRWQVLMELIAGCRTANDVNGYIINARRGQVGQLINLLRGGSSVTYGPHGKTQPSVHRQLARA